jgi:hypothetical protein
MLRDAHTRSFGDSRQQIAAPCGMLALASQSSCKKKARSAGERASRGSGPGDRRIVQIVLLASPDRSLSAPLVVRAEIAT